MGDFAHYGVSSQDEASGGVALAGSFVDEYALESRHVEQPWQVSSAELSVIGLFAEFWGADIQCHPVSSFWYGCLGHDFLLLDFSQRHLLCQSPVFVLNGVAHILAIHIQMSDGVVLFLLHLAASQCDFHSNRFCSCVFLLQSYMEFPYLSDVFGKRNQNRIEAVLVSFA